MSKRQDFTQFLSTPEPPELGPGPRSGVKSQAELEPQLVSLLSTSGLSDERRQLLRALILLWHDHLDPAHQIAQGIDNPDGAFVHGIMHRREPDFSNAAYWFRRVGRHPAFEIIAPRVNETLKTPDERALRTRLLPDDTWDPFAFIDACEQAGSKLSGQQLLLRKVQRIETEALLEYFLS
jgi:hypothetical protein